MTLRAGKVLEHQSTKRPKGCLVGARMMCEKDSAQDLLKEMESSLKQEDEVDEFKEIRAIQERLWTAAETGKQDGPSVLLCHLRVQPIIL